MSDTEYEILKPGIKQTVYIVDSTSRINNKESSLSSSKKLKNNVTDYKVPEQRKAWINCPNCNILVLRKNLPKHRRKKCKRALQQNQDTSRHSNALKNTNSNASLPCSNNEYKESRKLDGSRDYWQRRDNGRFGSHSSYDDMGDESFP